MHSYSSVFGKKKKKKPTNGDMALQITSMADIFTIILVFLLKTVSNGIASVNPSIGTVLPVSKGNDITKETLSLEVTMNGVMIDQKGVVTLKNFDFPVNEIQPNGASDAVLNALASQRKKLNIPNQSTELLVLADERTPYSTLKTVMASAANAGFVDLQLVVVQAD